jgi:hypothetical protein
MYHVYCEVEGAETITPDWPDAKRIFKRYCREWPHEEVRLDKLEDYEGIDDGSLQFGRRVTIEWCMPR